MINPEMRYQKHDAVVAGRKMTYVDVGEGDPIVFFHGNITSSYMWRNIIPWIEPHARCIAIDNIGQGDSDKVPGSEYRLADHQPYVDGLLEAIAPEGEVTLVMHDWGAQLGLTWARRNGIGLRGLVVCQGVIGNFHWDHWPPEVAELFRRIRSDEGERIVLEDNIFIETILPGLVLGDLAPEIHDEYRRPFLTPGEDRRSSLTWPREIPIEGEPADVLEVIKANNAWVAGLDVPKLFINTEPGAVLVGEHRTMVRGWPNVTEVVVPGLHYCQEDSPDEIGKAIAEWYRAIPSV